MSDPIPSREESLLAAAAAANALLWREYQRSLAVLKGLREESRSLSSEIDRARHGIEQLRKRPLRILWRKLRREITRPFRRRRAEDTSRPPNTPQPPIPKPSKAERRALAWREWIDLPESQRERSAALDWEIAPELCRAVMERTRAGERFLFAGCAAPSLALASLLRDKGCPTTVMGSPKFIRKLGRDGLRLEVPALAERLRYESEFTSAFEHVVLDARFLDEIETLPRLRLWPSQKIWLLHAPGMSALPRDIAAEAVDTGVPGLLHFDHAPRALLHPDWTFRAGHDRGAWPAPAEAATRYDPTLPSGKPWPRITVVTVTRNQGNFIRDTLDSVLSQGYPNLEYLVLDGASTDDTPRVIEEYRPRLAFAVSEPDRGQADALDRAFQRSSGDIMAWLNSDDRYLPGALKRVAIAFDENPEADLIAGGCALARDDSPEPFHIHHCRFPERACSALPLDRVLDLDGSWFKGDFFMQPEVFWRRGLWERAGARIDARLHYNMDYDLFARFAAAGAVLFHLPESLCLFRVHAAQKTQGEKPFIPEARQVRDELAARFAAAPPNREPCASS